MSDSAAPGRESSAAPPRRSGTVQAVERAFQILETIADIGGEASITELSKRAGLPIPTIHRLLQTLLPLGYVHQLPSRRYALGPLLVRLGERASGQLGGVARPELVALVQELGETANLAILDGDQMTYLASSPSPHAMRMFTEVGQRVHLHSSGVGKAVAAELPEARVAQIAGRSGLPAATPRTLTSLTDLLVALRQVREVGYAVDDEELQVGVRCYAVTVPGAPLPMAVSVIGPVSRVDDDFRRRAIPRLQAAAARVGALLSTD